MSAYDLTNRLRATARQLSGSTTSDLLLEAAEEFEKAVDWLETLLVDDYREDWLKIGNFIRQHKEKEAQ
jgi:hypothetical protein